MQEKKKRCSPYAYSIFEKTYRWNAIIQGIYFRTSATKMVHAVSESHGITVLEITGILTYAFLYAFV